eukprot:2483357-Pyramimonas_sp.AAC.1
MVCVVGPRKCRRIYACRRAGGRQVCFRRGSGGPVGDSRVALPPRRRRRVRSAGKQTARDGCRMAS